MASNPALSWSEVRQGRCLRVQWDTLLRGGLAIDPYLLWADLSAFAGMGGWTQLLARTDGLIPVLLEVATPTPTLSHPLLDDPMVTPNPMRGLLREIPEVYGTTSHGGKHLPRRFTAKVCLEDLPSLIKMPGLERLQLGLPRVAPLRPATIFRNEVSSAFQTVKRVVVGFIDDGCAFAHPQFTSVTESGARSEERTRVHFLWDQNLQPDGTSEFETRELGQVVLDKAVSEGRAAQDALEPYAGVDYGPVVVDLELRGSSLTQVGSDGQRYRLPRDALRTSSHGTSVMSLAAGRLPPGDPPAPLDAQRALGPDLQSPLATGVDLADRWPLIFVQLPTLTSLDTSGGSLAVHVLDGVHYILDRAARLPPSPGGSDSGARDSAPSLDGPPKYPENDVVINVSYGATAGCHDGTSILELALAELVTAPRVPIEGQYHQTGRRFITLAAGNSHNSRTHAQLRLGCAAEGELQWSVGPDNPLESYLEIWLPAVDVHGRALPETSADAFTIRVLTPCADTECHLRIGHAQLLTRTVDGKESPEVLAGVFFARRVVQGLNGTMVLLAAGRTRQPLLDNEQHPAPVAPHGTWRVIVSYAPPGGQPEWPEVVVHAWTERNDLLFGSVRAQQSTLTDDEPIPEPTEFTPRARQTLRHRNWALLPGSADPVASRFSLGSLAGLALDGGSLPLQDGGLFVVGAARLADGEMASYSSGGPSRHVDALRNAEPSALGAKLGLNPQDLSIRLDSRASARPRYAPDFSMPADVGTALRGLRVAGTRPAGQARLSGTSAAAPLLARWIANQLQAESELSKPRTPPQPASQLEKGADEAARPTTSPQADDKFRRGPNRPK